MVKNQPKLSVYKNTIKKLLLSILIETKLDFKKHWAFFNEVEITVMFLFFMTLWDKNTSKHNQ